MTPLWKQLPVSSTLWLGVMVFLQYGMLLLFCWLNRRYKGPMLLVAACAVCNFAAMCGNGFRMPVDSIIHQYDLFEGFVSRVASGELAEYVIVDHTAPLWFLGDVFPVTVISPGLASVGDVLLGAGVFWLLQKCMVKTRVKE